MQQKSCSVICKECQDSFFQKFLHFLQLFNSLIHLYNRTTKKKFIQRCKRHKAGEDCGTGFIRQSRQNHYRKSKSILPAGLQLCAEPGGRSGRGAKRRLQGPRALQRAEKQRSGEDLALPDCGKREPLDSAGTRQGGSVRGGSAAGGVLRGKRL